MEPRQWRTVQNDHSHTDEAAVLNDATVQRDRMADRHPVTDDDRPLIQHAVQDAAVLDVVWAPMRMELTSPRTTASSNARVLTEHHVTNQLRRSST